MDSFNFALAAAAWALASAAGVIALGVASLLGGRSRPRGAFAFGVFCVLWGLQIALTNVAGLVPGRGTASTLYLLALSCLLATPYFLVEFAATHAEQRPGRGRWIGARVAAALASCVAAGLLALAPGFLFERVFLAQGSRWFPDWGPAYVPLVVIPHFVAFILALFALRRARTFAPTPRTAVRALVVLAGLGLYVGFAAANNFTFFLYDALLLGRNQFNVTFAVFFALLTLGTAFVARQCWQDAKEAHSPDEARVARFAALALTVPLVWGGVEGLLAQALALSVFETVGLWRLAGVAVIAYGIARWRIYDLPQRARRAAVTAGGTTAATVTGAAAYGATTLVTTSAAVPWLAGLLVLGMTLVPSVRLARRLFGLDEASAKRTQLEETLYGQRIDSYRAALEASIARGTLDDDAEFLAALRDRFAITPAEERVLLHYARSSVIVARERHAWDAYERLRLLGEGGAGRTWLARDRARDRLVVLKEPLERWQQEPAAREAVLREARVAARIRHPNVVTVEEVVEGKGAPVIVMEYLEGGSLADVLRARGTLEWREAVAMTVDVLRGLEAVHAAGIVHRDVKPSNILLTGEGVPKLADFGIAVALSSGKTLVESSTTFAGTLSYVAPEVRAGGPADRRSDVYSAGALLHELLLGAPPSGGSVPARADVPPAVTAALARALAASPDARFPTARAFADALQQALA